MTDEIEFFESDQLIAQVEMRPTLYDMNLKEYHDKLLRDKLWREVCEAIIPKWAELSEASKDKTGRDVQKKWKNIRDCFRKELNHQKRCKAGREKRRKRRYIFYDQLLFLLPTIQEKDRKSESAQSSGEDAEENPEEATTATEQAEKIVYKPLACRRRRQKVAFHQYEEPYVPVFQDSEVEEIDEDKYFLLSLLPSLRNLTPDQKLTVKIEFLQTLRNVTYPNCSDIVIKSSPVFIEERPTGFELHRADDTDDNTNAHKTKQELDDL